MSTALAVKMTSRSQAEQRLGSYRLMGLLGRGGSASVYLAEHLYQRTPVAIKILNQDYQTKELRQLENEAYIVSHLRHTNIIRLLDYHPEASQPYLVMEHAVQGTLREHYPYRSLLPLHDILFYVKQIGSALQYMHTLGLIHRDIKPDNLLLTHNDLVLLADFGITVFKDQELEERDRMGTAIYVAPEQICGRPCLQSDQYSLAAVIYEWLCGEPPFIGNHQAIIKQQLFTSPIPLRARLHRLPIAVNNVIMQALSKEPSERFSNIQEFVDTLEIACEVPVY